MRHCSIADGGSFGWLDCHSIAAPASSHLSLSLILPWPSAVLKLLPSFVRVASWIYQGSQARSF